METLNPKSIFMNRAHAGQLLARRLDRYARTKPVVLALPRGGVVVAAEIASALNAPLEIIAVRKIGAPFHPEVGIGALVDGDEPELLLDPDHARMMGLTYEYLEAELETELREIRRREHLYRGGAARIDLAGRTVIVVDDGIATGSTMHAALRALRRARPRALILAVPVASPEAIESLRSDCDEMISFLIPRSFEAVGNFYQNFKQTTDEEVIELLQKNRRRIARQRMAWPNSVRGSITVGNEETLHGSSRRLLRRGRPILLPRRFRQPS